MVGDFHGTGIEIWAGFGPVGITEKKNFWYNHEQLLRPVVVKKRRLKRILILFKKKGAD